MAGGAGRGRGDGRGGLAAGTQAWPSPLMRRACCCCCCCCSVEFDRKQKKCVWYFSFTRLISESNQAECSLPPRVGLKVSLKGTGRGSLLPLLRVSLRGERLERQPAIIHCFNILLFFLYFIPRDDNNYGPVIYWAERNIAVPAANTLIPGGLTRPVRVYIHAGCCFLIVLYFFSFYKPNNRVFF